ncbi:MAG: hypothetical protein EOO75_09680, partial [Myxococcales bacterium]
MAALDSLLAPLDAATFLREHHQRRVHQWQTDSPLYHQLRDLFTPPGLESLLPDLTDILVWFRSRDGVPRSIAASPAQAWSLHQAGMTLYAKIDPGRLPAMAPVVELGREAARELGQSGEHFQIGLFASCAGAHTAPHFDSADGLTLH